MSALARFRGAHYAADVAVADGVTARFVDAGHILGSAIIEVRAQGRSFVFSGDIGRRGTPIVRDPTVVSAADYVLMESTYGGREHEPYATSAEVLAETCAPSAIRAACSSCRRSRSDGRRTWSTSSTGSWRPDASQSFRCTSTRRWPRRPRTSIAATASTSTTRPARSWAPTRSRSTIRARSSRTTPRSRAIHETERPYMIVASNGMLTGGRVLAHLRDLVSDPAATLLFVGYQGEGTLGAHLQGGATKGVIDGASRDVPCRLVSVSGFSPHADQPEQ